MKSKKEGDLNRNNSAYSFSRNASSTARDPGSSSMKTPTKTQKSTEKEAKNSSFPFKKPVGSAKKQNKPPFHAESEANFYMNAASIVEDNTNVVNDDWLGINSDKQQFYAQNSEIDSQNMFEVNRKHNFELETSQQVSINPFLSIHEQDLGAETEQPSKGSTNWQSHDKNQLVLPLNFPEFDLNSFVSENDSKTSRDVGRKLPAKLSKKELRQMTASNAGINPQVIQNSELNEYRSVGMASLQYQSPLSTPNNGTSSPPLDTINSHMSINDNTDFVQNNSFGSSSSFIKNKKGPCFLAEQMQDADELNEFINEVPKPQNNALIQHSESSSTDLITQLNQHLIETQKKLSAKSSQVDQLSHSIHQQRNQMAAQQKIQRLLLGRWWDRVDKLDSWLTEWTKFYFSSLQKPLDEKSDSISNSDNGMSLVLVKSRADHAEQSKISNSNHSHKFHEKYENNQTKYSQMNGNSFSDAIDRVEIPKLIVELDLRISKLQSVVDLAESKYRNLIISQKSQIKDLDKNNISLNRRLDSIRKAISSAAQHKHQAMSRFDGLGDWKQGFTDRIQMTKQLLKSTIPQIFGQMLLDNKASNNHFFINIEENLKKFLEERSEQTAKEFEKRTVDQVKEIIQLTIQPQLDKNLVLLMESLKNDNYLNKHKKLIETAVAEPLRKSLDNLPDKVGQQLLRSTTTDPDVISQIKTTFLKDLQEIQAQELSAINLKLESQNDKLSKNLSSKLQSLEERLIPKSEEKSFTEALLSLDKLAIQKWVNTINDWSEELSNRLSEVISQPAGIEANPNESHGQSLLELATCLRDLVEQTSKNLQNRLDLKSNDQLRAELTKSSEDLKKLNNELSSLTKKSAKQDQIKSELSNQMVKNNFLKTEMDKIKKEMEKISERESSLVKERDEWKAKTHELQEEIARFQVQQKESETLSGDPNKKTEDIKKHSSSDMGMLAELDLQDSNENDSEGHTPVHPRERKRKVSKEKKTKGSMSKKQRLNLIQKSPIQKSGAKKTEQCSSLVNNAEKENNATKGMNFGLETSSKMSRDLNNLRDNVTVSVRNSETRKHGKLEPPTAGSLFSHQLPSKRTAETSSYSQGQKSRRRLNLKQ